MKITFFCGPSHESWSPKSVNSGIGGSEEMVIGLAKELAKTDEVKVYNRCSSDAGVYDGVVYENYEDYEPEDTDVLIVWRDAKQLLKHGLDKINAKKYLWLHDLVNPADVIPYCMGFDGILCVSEYHQKYYQGWPGPEFNNKFIATRNAVDYSLFNKKLERDPKTIVYGSMYTRGLIGLLNIWPKIKLEVPDAKLRVFYGYETLEKMFSVETFKKLKKELEKMFRQDGVTHLGRISHEKVAEEYLKAGIWAYPTNYNEVSCITAMKAQIGGAIPVVLPRAALDETVIYGVKMRHGNNEKEILDNYSKELVRILNDPDQQLFRDVMQEGVKDKFTFEGLAKQWRKLWK